MLTAGAMSSLYNAMAEEVDKLAAEKLKRPFVPLKMRELRAMDRYAVEHSDYVLAVSESLSSYLKAHHGRGADIIIPPIVDGSMFRFSSTLREATRAKMGLIDNERLFLFIGGTAYWQRLDILKAWWDDNGANNTLLILTHNPEKMAKKYHLRDT